MQVREAKRQVQEKLDSTSIAVDVHWLRFHLLEAAEECKKRKIIFAKTKILPLQHEVD